MRYIFILALMLSGISAQAQTMEGRWLSSEWGGVRSIVEVAPCDQGLCGTIVGVQGGPAPDGAIGHRIMWGFEAKGDGTYSKGKLKPPGNAPQLNASIKTLTAETLVIRACILLICQNETMERL